MNNNNFELADVLDDIALSLSIMDFTSPKETLLTADKTLRDVDQLAKKMEIPSLRALCHWMLLNTEQCDKNEAAIQELSLSGSYFNWIEILSAQLRSDDQSLLQDLYDSLNSPKWFIKPSSILLNDLIKWLAKTTNTQANIIQSLEAKKDTNTLLNEEYSLNGSKVSHNTKPLVIDTTGSTNDEIITIDNSYQKQQNINILEEPIGAVPTRSNNLKLSKDQCYGLLSLELDELVMGLINLTSASKDVLHESSIFNNKLEHLVIFANKCEYSIIVQVTRWCQRNIDLFSRDKSQHLYRFIESGECWGWLELLGYSISDPDGLSNLSLLSTELNREAWLEPIAANDLQDLLLFIKTSKEERLNTSESTGTEDKTNKAVIDQPELANTHIEPLSNTSLDSTNSVEDESNLSFTWADDIHPELLAAYFEETPDLVAKLAVFLHKISRNEASKDDHQHASRVAHTIKGGSAVLGITALAEFSHKLEDILDYSVQNNLSKETSDFLSESSDCLENLFDTIQNRQEKPKEFTQVLNKLEQYAEHLENESSDDDELLELSTSLTLPDFITQDDKNKENTESTIASTDDEAQLSRLEEDFDIKDFTTEIDDIVMSLSTIYMTSENPLSDLSAAKEELQRLDLLSDISGYSEVSQISQWCQNNLTQFENEPSESSKEFIISGECWSWIELVGASLADPSEKSYLSLLSQELVRTEWIEPLKKENLQAILLLLNGTKQDKPQDSLDSNSDRLDKSALEVEKNNNNDNQVENASQSKYTLKWDDDIHPELLDVYLQETPDQIVEAALLIHKITKNEASKEDHQHAARIVHTIKGASGVVGITALAEFTHKLEDILDFSVEHKLPKEASKLLSESADCLEELFEAIINKANEPKEFSPTLDKLTEFAKNLDSIDVSNDQNDVELEMPELPDFIKAQDNGSNDTDNLTHTENPSSSNNIVPNSLDLQKENQEAPVIETHIKVPVAVIDKLLNLAGELITATTQISDKIQDGIETNKQIKSQDARVHKMLDELSSAISKQERNQKHMFSSLKDSHFDDLEMDTYNELHSVVGLLTESILDSEEIDNNLGKQLNELTEYTRFLAQLNKEFSDTILNSRMVSINALIPRLERIIRQTCRKTGKKAELAVSGNDINIDTDIFNTLTDPLLHLLRNSVDHGIEYPEDRKANGKYETGRIHLKFFKEGKFIHMELKDDGAGIDPNKIYHHALKKGLINSDTDYTENEILQLILQPGFTTQDKVTDISGRGVGMDVVANAVKRLKGTLEINSEKGNGTSFSIKVPLTLVTSGTLLVEISDAQVAIPVDSIEQLFNLAPNKVIEHDGSQFIEHNDTELPIISLASLLNWPLTKPDFSIANTLLLVKGHKEIHAVYIDKIIHSREVVIKSLLPWIGTDTGLIGACHLVDGGVAPVINLPQLLGLTETDSETREKYQVTTLEPENIIRATPKILVVDDSLSNRKALSLIVEQTEYDVLTAVDGLDALQIMNENDIAIVFTDLEMPRMNGLELTQSIRAWDIKKHTPVVMITSRTTSKHQQLAVKAGVNQYLTKPVLSETLIASIERWLQADLLTHA